MRDDTRGLNPSFLLAKNPMITEQQVLKHIETYIADTQLFLVDLKMGADRRIGVFIGGDSGVTVKECGQLNRYLNEVLDNDSNDFELVVSTPGVGEPLKVKRQYFANVGRNVKLKLKDGKSLEAELIEANDQGIVLKTRVKERIEGKKSKQWVEENHEIDFDSIAETKVLISFK